MNIGLSLAQKKLLNQLLLSSKEISCKGIRINMAKAEAKKLYRRVGSSHP